MGRNNEPLEWDTAADNSSYGDRNASHFGNFIDAVRAHDSQILNAEVLEGHISSALCHLGNVSYRVGRTLTFDSHSERFVQDDEANGYLSRRYRHPFVVPKHV